MISFLNNFESSILNSMITWFVLSLSYELSMICWLAYTLNFDDRLTVWNKKTQYPLKKCCSVPNHGSSNQNQACQINYQTFPRWFQIPARLCAVLQRRRCLQRDAVATLNFGSTTARLRARDGPAQLTEMPFDARLTASSLTILSNYVRITAV